LLSRVRPKNKPPLTHVRTISPTPKARLQAPASIPQLALPRRLWQMPLTWVKQEVFWRDVFAGLVGTGLAAVIAYLYAVGAGYIASPTKRQAMLGVALAALPAVIGFLATYCLHLLARHGSPTFRRRVKNFPYLFFWILVAAFFFIAADAIWPIPFWPFTLTP
jgi:hypothetical protein